MNPTGKFLKLNTSGSYATVSLMRNGKRKEVTVHRLVSMAYIPNPDCLPQVNHIDGNKLNNQVSNLEWLAEGNEPLPADNQETQ